MSNGPDLRSKIIETHNHLSDYNVVWFPFLFLKPQPNVEIGQKRILMMTLCFGVYGVLFLNIRYWLAGTLSLESFLLSLLYSNAAFFIWFQAVTSTLWNIRARKLQRDLS